MAFGVVVMLAVTGVLLVITDPFLALIGFSVGPLLGFTNYRFQRRMRAVASRAQRLRAEVAEIAHESFDAALVVKTLGREDDEVGRFGARSDELRDRMVEVGRLRAAFDPVIEALPNIGILAVLAVGAWRVDQGVVTPGTLITFAYLFRLVALPMRVFGWLLGELPRAVVGLDRVESVLNEEDSVSYGPRNLARGGGASAAAEGVGYLYPETDYEEVDDDVKDLSWTEKVDHPSEVLSSGESVEVMVLEVERESKKLTLGYRQLQENPWDTYEKELQLGSSQRGKLIQGVDRGVLILLQNGLKGFAPHRHLVKKDGRVAELGEELDFKVMEFSKIKKKVLLSHTATFSAVKEYSEVTKTEGRDAEAQAITS